MLPIAMAKIDGSHSCGTFTLPTVGKSNLPGLLGLNAMRDRNAILDMNTLQMHFAGQGKYDLPNALPPGTESYQLEIAPSGHLVLPCCEYAAVDKEQSGRLDTGPALALVATSSSSSL